ncbi:MAG: c-type cytochrome [Ferruginibacter sp.]|nr:c-type cytochrome [Chitinophagaceae bacterium]
MRKFIALAAICSVIIMAAYFSACKDKKSETKISDNKDSVKKVLERGHYLAVNVAGCVDCHSKRDFTKFSGPVIPGTEGGGGMVFDNKLAGLPGTLYGKNITPDNETGIGTWTDDDILKALTQGINKKGDTLFPLMPYAHFNHMAKDDLMSIIAYLRTVKPIRNAVPARQLMIPIAMAYPGPALQPSIDANVRPPESDKVKYGEYLTNAADCATCHTPQTQQGPDMTRMFAGGFVFDAGTFKVVSSNITPDSETGIGAWTEAQFLKKFTHCREEKNYNFNPGKENTVMPLSLLSGMTDEDLKAIYAYLRTVKPISNKVEKYPK